MKQQKNIWSALILIFILITTLVYIKVIQKEFVPITTVSINEEISIEDHTIKEKDPYESMNEELLSISDIQDELEWFRAYKNITYKYKHLTDTPDTIWDVFSDEDILLMLRCVETECYEADFISKVNVSSVIFNRFEHGGFGDTVGEVITAKNQFAYHRTSISESTILAVEYAYEIGDTVDGSIGFHSNSKTKTFNGWEYVFTDNVEHHFYRPRPL